MRLPSSLLLVGLATAAPIAFRVETLPFTLDSSESAERRVPETMAGGVALFDYNNDGALDAFFTNGADLKTLRKQGARHWNRLLANDGKGHFTDVTEKAGLQGVGFDNAAAAADYDNDGFTDLFVGGVHRNTLYHNNGDGTFTDVTAKARLPVTGTLWNVGAVWADFNGDAKLDLFIVNYLDWDYGAEPPCIYGGVREYCHPKFYKPTANQLFLNNGDGTFRDASVSSGVAAHKGKGMGAAVADYDLDGRLDVFVTNDGLPNSLFHNEGGGKFREVALDAGVALIDSGESISGMGVDFRDIDNDGYPDIVFVALDHETFPVFINTRKGSFADATIRSRMGPLSRTMAGYSPLAADFDNDGWKDVFVTRGHVQLGRAARPIEPAQPNTLFRNLGEAHFEALTTGPARRHRGSAVGDLDGDGRLDAVVAAIGEPAEIWRNEFSPRNWLELRLQGTRSNRDAIGARTKVTAPGLTQWNHVTHAAGYASSSAGPLHFGLGSATRATLIEIRWPSGTIQTLRDVAAGQILNVREP